MNIHKDKRTRTRNDTCRSGGLAEPLMSSSDFLFVDFLDVDDLLYRQKGKSNISPAGNISVSNLTEKSLLVISNRFGIIILATQKGKNSKSSSPYSLRRFLSHKNG